MSRNLIFVLILSLLLTVTGCSSDGFSIDEGSKNEKTSQTDNVIDDAKSEADKKVESDDVSIEYKNAYKKAKDYAEIMHMSKQAIYNQLTSEYGEKFEIGAAQYAVDNLDVDFNEQALIKAEDYSETMHMSKQSIYDQLISEYGEKFTEEEAQYAVDNLVADYNANALAQAKSYQETMSMSASAIYDQLISEYGEKFTEEEAQYAIDHLND